jgi:hypothetical protein
MKFKPGMVPLATSMIQLAEQVMQTDPSAFQAFVCYWAAFANICTMLATQSGLRPRFGLRQNGTLRTRKVKVDPAGRIIKMAEVYPPTEKAKLDNAFKHFSDDLKHRLIMHPGTHFFVYRTPTWEGRPLKRDAFKQSLNGVINVGATVDARYPVWSPLSVYLYKQYSQEGPNSKTRNILSKQILDVLDTIHLNLRHGPQNVSGDRQAEDENDSTVVAQALPLLSMIVLDFVEI